MDVFGFIHVRTGSHATTTRVISRLSVGVKLRAHNTALYVTVYLTLTVMETSSDKAQTEIANLMWSFENLDYEDDAYTANVDKILNSINDLRAAEVTTVMSPEKLVKWDHYVTGLEDIIRSRYEVDDYRKKMRHILKSLNDLRSAEVTTLMSSEDILQWNKHVTGMEDIVASVCAADPKLDELKTRAKKVRSAVTLVGAAMQGLEFIPVILDDDNDSSDPDMPPLEKNNTMQGYPDEDIVYDDLPRLEKLE